MIVSTLFRISSYVFLRIIPTRLGIPVIPVLFVSYLFSVCFLRARPRRSRNHFVALALSLPSHSRLINIFNLLINLALFIATLDLALTPFYDAANDVTFTRVGGLSPDTAKVLVRYPNQPKVLLLYRDQPSAAWKDGPEISLTEDQDWAATVALSNLWPETTYEYALAHTNRTLLPYPQSPIRFRTFPDPRLHPNNHFSFLASSCITPNFPYRGPLHRRSIRGFDLLHQYLPASNSSLYPKFLLFLGDFIYADVPLYIGDNKHAYQRLYRRNYNSPSFRQIYENLPIFHTYDDHEFINNYAGEGYDVPPFHNASDAYSIYAGNPNPDGATSDNQYYSFQYGDVPFFVMDTRRYRSPVESTPPLERTMLGSTQLSALYNWLHKVNETTSFKFIVSSVPFTSLWTHDAQLDSWAAYPTEKAALLQAFHTIPNLIILSGDRHEFAAIEFNSPDPLHYVVREFSTSPLNMFYVPLVHTLRQKSEAAFPSNNTEGNLIEIPYERAFSYLPEGNSKWAYIELDTTNQSAPIMHLETVIDGRPAYNFHIIGIPAKSPSTRSIGTFVTSNVKDIFDKIGLKPARWF